MTVPFDFATRCPRLALAHRQRAAELVAERAARRRAVRELQRAEALVAHRELQLLRAGAGGNRRYISLRTQKLVAARRRLAAAQRTVRELNAPPRPGRRRAA